MQMIIEVRLVDDVQETARIHLAVVDREFMTSPLGLSLAEGKALLASAQQYLVRAQCEGIGAAHAHCEICRVRLTMKGWHRRQIRTVFGRVTACPRSRCATGSRRSRAHLVSGQRLEAAGAIPTIGSVPARSTGPGSRESPRRRRRRTCRSVTFRAAVRGRGQR